MLFQKATINKEDKILRATVEIMQQLRTEGQSNHRGQYKE